MNVMTKIHDKIDIQHSNTINYNPTQNNMAFFINCIHFQVKQATSKSFFWLLKAKLTKNRIVPVTPRIWSANTDRGLKVLSLMEKSLR